jgi:hypothetical protein
MDPAFTRLFARKPLHKITANYIPRSIAALDLATELTGDTQTDTLNRAIQIYAYLLHVRKESTADAEAAARLLGQI